MLKDTGERVIPEKMDITNELLIEHIARYHFSVPHVHGKVLDFATGVGYGAHVVAKKCKHNLEEIIGVDIDPKAIQYAKTTYYHPLSKYMLADVTDLALPDQLGTFDVILSFETIEHIENEDQFMENIYHLLKPGGSLILSTPFGAGKGKPCSSPFHVHQMTENEFSSMFDQFKKKRFFYQKGALIEPIEGSQMDRRPLGVVIASK
ncbi:Methyltransferase domain-containing protein [Gracilibacillus orientalis]|uniref:Methyltransferase domain-containing protein n=1 Tax=Gracilibacillus orientalis TaxID=334253 RepID=A0A1I4QTU0_9BACI|nr:Methyltransferase domain-containing protein [Gracilibacillus orientalis]